MPPPSPVISAHAAGKELANLKPGNYMLKIEADTFSRVQLCPECGLYFTVGEKCITIWSAE